MGRREGELHIWSEFMECAEESDKYSYPVLGISIATGVAIGTLSAFGLNILNGGIWESLNPHALTSLKEGAIAGAAAGLLGGAAISDFCRMSLLQDSDFVRRNNPIVG